MRAYVDTSVLLRLILREAGALADLSTFDQFVSSELIATESHRTIDRMRLQGALTTEEAAARTGAIADWLEAIDLVQQAADLIRCKEARAAEIEARAHDLARRAVEQLNLAERRVHSAEAARRAAEAGIEAAQHKGGRLIRHRQIAGVEKDRC